MKEDKNINEQQILKRKHTESNYYEIVPYLVNRNKRLDAYHNKYIYMWKTKHSLH